MATWSPLTTHWAVNLQDCSPRNGARIDTIIHHHAASTNKLATLALFAPGGREVTPNYFIAGAEIWGIVPEDYRAWTSGSYLDDQRAITYEILNSGLGPGWPFDPVTMDTVARLDADIASRYGVPLVHAQPGFMEHRNVYEWFGRGFATACAGPSFSVPQIITATAVKLSGANAPVERNDEMPKLLRNHDGTIGLLSDAGELDLIGDLNEVEALKASGLVGDWVQMPDGLVFNLLSARTARLKAARAGSASSSITAESIAKEIAPLLVPAIIEELGDVSNLSEEQVADISSKVTRSILREAGSE